VSAPNLRRLQQWLDHVMRHRSTADVAMRSRAARALFPLDRVLAGGIVRPNERMTVADRLQVYNGGYLARLEDVLASDYGALRHLVGDDAFHRLCERYVERHPSRHPNLNQLGRHLPGFVATQRWLPHRAFAVEVARLEDCVTIAFDAPAFTPVPAEVLRGIAPADWERARLLFNPSVSLCVFRWPTNAYYTAWKTDAAPRPPRPRASHVAVFRRDFKVFRLDLEPAAHAVLSALQRGTPLGRALRRARGGDVGTWFKVWAQDGLFADVRLT
jgi:hypothetical protein